MYRGSFVIRLLAFLVLIGILVAGGVLLYRAGFTQGYVQGTTAGAAGSSQVGPGQPNQPVPYYPGYWPWWGYPHFGFFPFGGFLGFFFFIFLVFGLMRLLFRPHYWGGWGAYPRHWRGWGAPPWAKGNQPGEDQAKPESPPKDAG